jgi:pimeloyl-ACP methyl ester carboxylesterase
MWVNRHRLNNSLVVFIHGVFGKRWATWKGIPDVLQDQCLTEPLLRSYDFFLWEYETDFWRQAPIDPVVIDQLDQFMEDQKDKYATSVLIGHSQGGIIAKLYVLKKLAGGHGTTMNVDMVITIGTPHLGSHWANILYLPQRIPIIRSLIPCRQVSDLASLSPNIRKLGVDWPANNRVATPGAPVPRHRYVRSVNIVGAFDRLVRARSAAGFRGDVVRFVSKGHPILGPSADRPVSRGLAQAIIRELSDHGGASQHIKDLVAIRGDAAKRRKFVQENAQLVHKIVNQLRPALPGDGQEMKTASLLIDFLDDFQTRPLRGLSMRNSLKTYVERILGRDM